ncbi:MAG: ArsR/SmtB family transcription factor [Candidatus Hodarchaeales archaeon]
MRTVFDSFQEGKKQARQLKESFDRSENIINAFEDDFLYSNYEFCLNTNEIQRLSHLLGQLVNTVSLSDSVQTIAMVGPQRSGKTTAARFISEEINKKFKSQYTHYVKYSEKFWDWWENVDFKETQILFFDGIFPIWNNLTEQSLKDLEKRSQYDKVIIVVILNTIEYHWLRLQAKKSSPLIFGKKAFEFHFKKPSQLEIEQMLKLRIEAIGNKQLLSNDVIKSVSILSLGLPGLALWLTRHLPFSDNEDREIRTPTLEDLHIVTKRLGFEPALRIVIENNLQISQELKTIPKKEIWPIIDPLREISSAFSQSLKQVKKISTSRLPILEEMIILDHLEGTVKRSSLQERTGIKDSSLTYQCQNLIKEDIVTYFRDGREVFYQLTSPIKEALQLLFFD